MQHNLRTVAGYYKRIRMARLGELLGLSVDQAERQIADLVTSGYLYARIDRPAGVVVFDKRSPPEETLSNWASDMGSMLSLLERTCHLTTKEMILHKVA